MNRSCLSIICTLAVLCLLPACSSEVSSAHVFRLNEDDGILIAETTGGPKYSEEIFMYEKVLEVKEDPEQPESLLYRPNGMVMGNMGHVYVNDTGSSQIVVFDQNGNYLRRIGRQGDGPGEFRNLDILSVSEGVLSLYDVALNRATRYRTDGTLIDVNMIPVAARSYFGSSLVTAMHQEEDGKKILIQYVMDLGTNTGTYQYRAAVLGSESDTLWSVATANIRSFYLATMPAGTGGMISQIMYGPLPALCYHPDTGILVSDGDKSELSQYETDGTLQRRIRIDLEPDPVTSEERARIMDRYNRRIVEAEGPQRDIRKAQKDAVVIADEKPCWTDVKVDDDGFIWLLISETQQEWSERGGKLFRVLSPKGEYLGDSRWPTSAAHARLSRGHLLFNVTNEETGATVPSVFRMSSAIRGFTYP